MSSLSVVLCTYNGAAYLPQQLASLRAQTRLPDEMVVRDDGSTDATLDLLNAFADEVPFPVTIMRNPDRLGVPDNFWAAMNEASGDLIALCDQDDVWAPLRLERAVDVLDADPTVGATFSDGWCIDRDGVMSGRRLWEAAAFTGKVKGRFRSGHELEVLLSQSVVTGATLTFRRQLIPSMVPWPPIPHDYWISGAVSLQARLEAIDEPLIDYRLHDANTIGFPKGGVIIYYRRKLFDPQFRLKEMASEAAFLGGLANLLDRMRCDRVTDEEREFVVHKAEMLRFRLSLPGRAWLRLPQIAGRVRCGDYRRYANGTPSWMLDLFRY